MFLGPLPHDKTQADVHLVMAGGYDTRVVENVEYFEELQAIVAEHGLEGHITFLRSFRSVALP